MKDDFCKKAIILIDEKGLKRKDIAEELGISAAYLSDILLGKRMAKRYRHKIAKILGFEYEDLRLIG
ncbi:helix-turn-helix domain-containing protein [Vallitalea guaymasensis]|uniref:helix-turn-helix domain-containing protein n=1 Tax=Vallitalea guaymasensis TaxID=1185412 RepID=UPI000DE4DBEC|nr:helix-turn-helix transcriptional regulator [Vallitalea guaymasensis]